MRTLSLLVTALLLSGCGFIDPAGTPMVVAHRSGAGNWPENSRTAVQGAIAAGYPGIEFDLVLTEDLQPVLSHDPWLNEVLCTNADGSALPAERILIKDLTLSELQSNYRCGGVADPEQPSAQVIADTHLPFAELLDLTRSHPDLFLHLDIKYERGLTPPGADFLTQIFDRMGTSGNTNPWFASSAELDFVELAADAGEDIAITWPKFKAGEDTTLTALGNEALAQLGLGDPLALAARTGATGLDLQYRVIDQQLVQAARARGIKVALWTLNDDAVIDRYCQFPADYLITDSPELAECL